MKKPTLKFTVKLSKWRCGHGGVAENSSGVGETLLLNSQGYKCCLGFACQQAGFKGKLTGLGTPGDTRRYIPGLTVKGYGDYDKSISTVTNTEFTREAIKINDCIQTTVETKMRELKELGSRYNIKINFIK